MEVYCLCGQQNHIEMPLEDTRRVRINCTSSCRTARQLKADLAPRPLSEKLSDAFPNVTLGFPPIGMLGH
jgi:hypothetical protein